MSTQPHVLIVDDEERLVKNLQVILKRRGLKTSGATSGKEALKTLQELESIDVILLDIQMDGMDGIDVLREVNKLSPQTQVILYTGNATIQQGIEGLELGAFYYTQKPAPIEELVDHIFNAYSRKKRKYG